MSPLFKLFRLKCYAGALTAVLGSPPDALPQRVPAAGSQQVVAINAVSAQGIGEKSAP